MSFILKIPVVLLPREKKLKEGEVVDWTDKSLEETKQEEICLNLSQELGIASKDIFKHLKVSLAQKIAPEAVIAEKKTFFSEQKIRFPKEAEIRSIDHEEGTVTLAIEKKTNLPFAFKAKFNKEKDGYLEFVVQKGIEIEIVNSLESSFGGQVSYLFQEAEIISEKIQDQIVVTGLSDKISLSKIAAFDPLAVVVHQTTYYPSDLKVVTVVHKTDFQHLLHHTYEHALYLINQKTIYFYQP